MNSSFRGGGFTLVEVVVAMAVLSLLMLAVVTGLRTLGNTQVALERKTGRVDEVRTVSGFLRDLMESAIVGSDGGGLTLGGGDAGSTYFQLVDGGAEWKSTILFGESFGGTYVVRVASEGEDLVLRWARPLPTGEAPDNWDQMPSRVLVRDLEEFEVHAREDFDSEWTDRWVESRVAPALVRMQVKSGGRFWPALIMQVQR